MKRKIKENGVPPQTQQPFGEGKAFANFLPLKDESASAFLFSSTDFKKHVAEYAKRHHGLFSSLALPLQKSIDDFVALCKTNNPGFYVQEAPAKIRAIEEAIKKFSLEISALKTRLNAEISFLEGAEEPVVSARLAEYAVFVSISHYFQNANATINIVCNLASKLLAEGKAPSERQILSLKETTRKIAINMEFIRDLRPEKVEMREYVKGSAVPMLLFPSDAEYKKE